MDFVKNKILKRIQNSDLGLKSRNELTIQIRIQYLRADSIENRTGFYKKPNTIL